MKSNDPAKRPLPATDEPGPSGSIEARELGARDAELFDLRLRHREACHIIRCVTHTASPGWNRPEFGPRRSAPDTAEVGRRRDLLRHHLGFCRALEGSRPWRLARRLGPRRWRPPIETRLTDREVASLDGGALDAAVERVSAFVRRVLESPEWRLLQRLRGIAGRKW